MPLILHLAQQGELDALLVEAGELGQAHPVADLLEFVEDLVGNLDVHVVDLDPALLAVEDGGDLDGLVHDGHVHDFLELAGRLHPDLLREVELSSR